MEQKPKVVGAISCTKVMVVASPLSEMTAEVPTPTLPATSSSTESDLVMLSDDWTLIDPFGTNDMHECHKA